MKFNNPAGQVIEGRLPTQEDNFYEDRYYSTVENVFIRFDPQKEYVKVIMPFISEFVLKITYEAMNELAKKNATLIDIISADNNVVDISKEPKYGYYIFSEDPDYFVLLKKGY